MTEPLDSRQLRAFSILARTGSFTQTARELHLSQSAVSHSMKALEESTGCRLLDRIGKTAVLTQAGEQLLLHAERILKEMELARDELGGLGRWGVSRLRIGTSTSGCQYIIPKVLREFKESFPKCQISIEAADTAVILESLRQHKIDLAVHLQPHKEEQFEFRKLFTDELHFVVSPAHPWAVSGRVDRKEIAKQNYIFYGKNTYTTQMIESYFQREDIVLNSMVDLGNMEAIKELIKIGLGISILAPWTAGHELREGSLVAIPLGRRRLRRSWGILHWKGRALTFPEETFAGLCESVCEEIGVRD